jgi:hypothetical protein
MADIVDILLDLDHAVTRLAHRFENADRHAVVHTVDPARQRARVRLGGTDDKPFLSPWVPYSQVAGAFKFHSPPSVGQQVTFRCPDGDFRQGYITPLTWSDANRSPSNKGDEHVAEFGEYRSEIRKDEFVQKVPKHRLESGSTFITFENGGGHLG